MQQLPQAPNSSLKILGLGLLEFISGFDSSQGFPDKFSLQGFQSHFKCLS